MNKLAHSISSSVARSGPGRIKQLIQFALYQVGPICIVISTLLIWPALGRFLSPATVGDLSLILATMSLLSPVLCCGAHLYVANRLASAEMQARLPEVQTAAVLSLGLYGLSIVASASGLLLDWPMVQISVALASANAAYMVASGVMRGANQAWQFALISFVIQVVGLAALGFAFLVSDSFRLGVAAYIILIALPVSMQWKLLRVHVGKFNLPAVVGVLRLSVNLVPHLLLSVALLMAMRIVVSVRLGSEEVAYYTFAALLIGGTLTVASSLDAHWSIRAQSSLSPEAMRVVLQKNQMRCQVLLLLASLMMVTFLVVVLKVWLPSGYDHRSVMLAVLLGLPAAAMQSVADGRSALLVWSGRPGRISVSTAAGTFVTLGTAYVLLPVFGWPIAGVCISLGTALRMFCSILLARYVHPQSAVGFQTLLMVSIQILAAIALVVFFLMGVV